MKLQIPVTRREWTIAGYGVFVGLWSFGIAGWAIFMLT